MDPIKYGKALKVAGKRNRLKFEAWENHDHHEFLSKINQNPQDVFAHDVYADWLQDQGKDLHAQMIRDGARPHYEPGVGHVQSNFDTYAEPGNQSDFGVHAFHTDGVWGVDLSSGHFLPNGGSNTRRVWTKFGLTPEEAGRLYHGLRAEGAVGSEPGAHHNVPPLPQQVTNAGLQ